MKQLKKQITKKISKSQSNLLAFISFKGIKHLSKRLLILVFFAIVGFSSTMINDSPVYAMDKEKESRSYVYSLREKTNNKLIKEVDTYMKRVSPKSKINPGNLVLLCRKYQMDISFVIAQGIIESNLGTSGKAATTNSVWNVGSYDNGVVKFRYSTPDESVEPYLKLIKHKYLMSVYRGDTIHKKLNSLIKDGGYVNRSGKRFATALNYENELRKMMLKVNMETSISIYQGILYMKDEEILDFFLPSEANKKENLALD